MKVVSTGYRCWKRRRKKKKKERRRNEREKEKRVKDFHSQEMRKEKWKSKYFVRVDEEKVEGIPWEDGVLRYDTVYIHFWVMEWDLVVTRVIVMSYDEGGTKATDRESWRRTFQCFWREEKRENVCKNCMLYGKKSEIPDRKTVLEPVVFIREEKIFIFWNKIVF